MAYFEMSLLALKWALKRPPTSRYPFEPLKTIPGSRGRLILARETCVYCTVCAKKCPTQAIAVDRGRKQWGIDRLRCVSCGYCVEVCPKESLALAAHHVAPAVTKDLESC
jgi:formate hydrogenlyase subunit 6/NADH:ubiquinone oxidoreductase subunit I